MSPHRKHILYVEDDDETCLLITNLLKLINCEVTLAKSISEAREVINSRKFDLYLLDNWLPGGSGADFCQEIRQSTPSTPIIFYSGAAYESDKQEAIEAGAQAYLVKPTDISELVKTVEGLLSIY
jgi:two-component system, OmpR family, phosphate regulon response regulator PhoB